jgi:hypothetical protein
VVVGRSGKGRRIDEMRLFPAVMGDKLESKRDAGRAVAGQNGEKMAY